MTEFEVNPAKSINFAPSDVVEEVLQNVATLLGTMRYTVPYDRTLGLESKFLDNPTPATRARLTAEVITMLREREPRAVILEVRFKEDQQEGILIPTVRVGINVE